MFIQKHRTEILKNAHLWTAYEISLSQRKSSGGARTFCNTNSMKYVEMLTRADGDTVFISVESMYLLREPTQA